MTSVAARTGADTRPPVRPPEAAPTLPVATRIGWVAAVAAACLGINALFSRYLFWDSFFNLVSGRLIAQHGIPRHEVLTIEAKRDWVDQQWLAHRLYYESWSLGGYRAMAVLSAVLVTAGFTLLAALLIRRGVPEQRAVMWTLVALVVAMGNTVVRAQSFAFPLFVLLLWGVLADRERRRFHWRIALLVPLLVVWANVHGTVLLGAALLAAYATWRAVGAALGGDRRSSAGYALVAVAAPATVFANPYGVHVVHYYWALLGNRTVGTYILEWSSPSLVSPFSVAFFALLLAVAVVVGYAFGRGYRPSSVLLVGTAALAALASQGVRYQVWFGIVAVTLAAEVLARTRPRPPDLPRHVVVSLAAAVAVLAVLGTASLASTSDAKFERFVPQHAVEAAARYAAAHPGARVLADENASALLWKHEDLEGRVGFDTRLEQYPEDKLLQWFEYLNVDGPDWLRATRGYDLLVASRDDHPELIRRLTALDGWRTLYADADGAAFVSTSRRDSAP